MADRLWNEEKVITEVLKVKEKLKKDTLPTYDELHMHSGQSLVNAVSKRFTLKRISEKTGIQKTPVRQRSKRSTRKQDMSMFVNKKKIEDDEKRDKKYIKQCKASEIKEYILSPNDLKKYQKLPPPKQGMTSVAQLNAMARGWGYGKQANVNNLEGSLANHNWG